MRTIRLLIFISIVSLPAQRSMCAPAPTMPATSTAPAASTAPATTTAPATNAPASAAQGGTPLNFNNPNGATAAPAQPEKPSPELLQKYKEAAIEMEKKNYEGALAKVDEAERLAPTNPNLENLRGAIYTQQKNYAKAAEAFTKAAQLDKKSFSPRYNLCEILFLQKKYPDALTQFQALQSEDPKNNLVKYKVFLCYLAQDNTGEAKKILDKMDPFDELPVYYFSQAAWDFKNSDPAQAKSWLISARNIYPPQKNALFVDALMELGYIPREPEAAPAK